MAKFTFRTSDYRALPLPLPDPASQAKLGTCFTPADGLTETLLKWRQVNPRLPKVDKKEMVKGPVAKAIKQTLLEAPEKFAVMNQGIYLLVERVEFDKGAGGLGTVTVELTNPERHGVVNGGHTLQTILEAQHDREVKPEDYPGPWPAQVRLHIYEGVGLDLIPELAEGLNRSLQVDNPSLENLRKTFDAIKAAMGDKPGAKQIAYKQGETGEVDVGDVLSYLSLFNLSRFPDRKKHPNVLFGQPKAVLEAFVEDQREATKDEPAGPRMFDRIIPRTHDILVLADRIRQAAMRTGKLGKLKVSNAKNGNRAGSSKHKGQPAHFAGGTIDGLCHEGWLRPMLAAFRADMDTVAWAKGKFEWLQPPENQLPSVIDEMVEIVNQEHTDNKQKPAEVGRKEAAYRLCYGVIRDQLHADG